MSVRGPPGRCVSGSSTECVGRFDPRAQRIQPVHLERGGQHHHRILLQHVSGAAANAEVWTTTGLAFNGSYVARGTGCGTLMEHAILTPGLGLWSSKQLRHEWWFDIRPGDPIQWRSGLRRPATAGSGDYLYYSGGLIVQQTPTFAASTTPYTFKDRARCRRERGVRQRQPAERPRVRPLLRRPRSPPEDADAFGSQRMLPIDDMVDHLAAERHLPTMKGGGMPGTPRAASRWTT